MKKSILTLLTLLATLTAFAEGGPHFDKGELLLLGFIAVAIVIIVLCLVSALIMVVLQGIFKVKKYFFSVFLGCLIASIVAAALFVSFEEEMIDFSMFLLVVMPLIGSAFGFWLSPVKIQDQQEKAD